MSALRERTHGEQMQLICISIKFYLRFGNFPICLTGNPAFPKNYPQNNDKKGGKSLSRGQGN